jgi:hypothetical protein
MVFAVLGALATWYFNVRFSIDAGGGFDMLAFMRAAFANHAASSLSCDAIGAAATFMVWVFFESRRLGMRRWWLYVLLTMCVALAFAFPLFLFMREKRLVRPERAV